jgi:hypothetical protein
MAYQAEGVPLVVLGGAEYGSGSSRDWAAKGTNLLGVRAVIAASFERIHRSNLVGMGVLPLQADVGDLLGDEEITIVGLAEPLNAGELPREVTVRAGDRELRATVRIDTPKEAGSCAMCCASCAPRAEPEAGRAVSGSRCGDGHAQAGDHALHPLGVGLGVEAHRRGDLGAGRPVQQHPEDGQVIGVQAAVGLLELLAGDRRQYGVALCTSPSAPASTAGMASEPSA